MQYQPLPVAGNPPQLSLFEGLLSQGITPFARLEQANAAVQPAEERLSEMTLTGSEIHCRLLIAPILRDLSQAIDTRWLTLIAPPGSLSNSWLKESGFNRDRILLLPARASQTALDLACKALMSGCSHTVITWFDRLDHASRARLRTAAEQGAAQSLNIRMA